MQRTVSVEWDEPNYLGGAQSVTYDVKLVKGSACNG